MKTVQPLLCLAALVLWTSSAVAQPASDRKEPAPKKAAKASTDKTVGPALPAEASIERDMAGKAGPTSPAGPRGASWHAEDSYLEILRLRPQKPLLVIHYPWKAHAKPSVEVRQLAPDEPDTGEIRPLGFTTRIMKADVLAAVYQCRDRDETSVARKMKHAERDFELVGDRNRLGNGSVLAVFPPKPGDKMPVARVVYPLLDSWALDARTLMLELPESQFAQPCWIRVWLLREGEILWWKTVRWPGEGRGKG